MSKPSPTTTIHLRIPIALRDAIAEYAAAERRPWTQMAVLMLQDAALQRSYDSGFVTPIPPRKRKAAA